MIMLNGLQVTFAIRSDFNFAEIEKFLFGWFGMVKFLVNTGLLIAKGCHLQVFVSQALGPMRSPLDDRLIVCLSEDQLRAS